MRFNVVSDKRDHLPFEFHMRHLAAIVSHFIAFQKSAATSEPNCEGV
jgi:hypothetical protein